jgi:hypothetical protein
MVDEKFNSITELYIRVLPALKSKKRELEKNKVGFITEKDIWDYLRDMEWNKKTDLTLFDIVNDILNVSQNKLFEYLTNKK